jgi:hypothetical protein
MKRQTLVTNPKPEVIALPAPVIASDLKRPDWDAKDKLARSGNGYDSLTFEIWYTARFGWCIPTLLIRQARRGSDNMNRNYAIAIKGEQPVRIGLGPHVLRHETVYVRESRVAALKPLLDVKARGEVVANEARDIRSSRMLAGTLRRRSFGGIW